VVCLARKTFDYEKALATYEEQQKKLRSIKEVDWTFIEGLTIEIEDAEKAIKKLSAADLDGLVIISGTFHLGHLALLLAREINRPVLLWAFSEPPYDGGKIRFNSACGVNLNASNLYKAGFKEFDYHLGDDMDESWLEAVRIRAALRQSRVGIIGSHAHGFYNMEPRALPYFHDFGALLIQYQINEFYGEEVEEGRIREQEEKARTVFNCEGVSDEQIGKVARLSASIRDFMKKRGLTAVAVRCWPEFADRYGIAPCAAMSLCQGDGLLTACEGDVELALSMIVLRALGEKAPFSADLSQVTPEDDTALLWHCGVAPYNLWDGKCVRSLDSYHAGGRGVTADFVMQEGRFTVVRLDHALGDTRLLLGRGQAMAMDKLLKGTYARVRFDNHIEQVYEGLVMNGFAHHVAMGYGDYRNELLKFARMMKLSEYEL